MTPSVEEVHRAEFGRVVAALAGRFRDLDLAEECAQEAFVEAVRRWPSEGTPPNPGGWLTVVARNKALDRLRRESTRQARHEEADMLHGPGAQDGSATVSSVVDDRLRLLFTCCHPALAPEARVALTLRLLGGLTVPEVANAFLVPERTMAQRITRAKRKIGAANIPYRVPRDAELPGRLAGVLAVVYLVFTEGHLPGSGAEQRADLTAEAIRLGRLLRDLMPDEPEVAGLLALMLLTEARREARFRDGVLVPLPEQDRSRWDRGLVEQGHALVRECLRRNRPGHYQLLAAVNAVHADAATAEETDWAQVVALYDLMQSATPTSVVALNRAVAVAELEGPAAGLVLVDGLSGLEGYHPFHATRADLLRRLGRTDEAAAAYDRALELATNPGERAFLEGRRASLVG